MGLIALGAGLAFAYWVTTDSSNPAAAVADSLPTGATPGTPTTNGANGSTVSLSFSEVSTTTGHMALTSYTVTRYPSGSGSGTVTSATCSIALGTVNCSETSVPNGTWVYTDTPKISGTNWVGIESAKSPAVTVDATTPTASAPGVTANVHYGTSPIWVDNETVTLTNSPTDVGGTGVASVAYYYCPTSAGSCTSSTPWHLIGPSSTGPSWSVALEPLPGGRDLQRGRRGHRQQLQREQPVGGHRGGHRHHGTGNDGQHSLDWECLEEHDQTVTLSPTDVGSGVAQTYYTTDGSTPSEIGGVPQGTTKTGTSILLNTSGQYTIKYFSVDNVGNVEAVETAGTVIRIDLIAPVVPEPMVNGH